MCFIIMRRSVFNKLGMRGTCRAKTRLIMSLSETQYTNDLYINKIADINWLRC